MQNIVLKSGRWAITCSAIAALITSLCLVATPVAAESAGDELASEEVFGDGICGGFADGLDLDVCTCGGVDPCNIHLAESGDTLEQQGAGEDAGSSCDGAE